MWLAEAAGIPEGESKLKSERIARAWTVLAVSAELDEAEACRRRGGH